MVVERGISRLQVYGRGVVDLRGDAARLEEIGQRRPPPAPPAAARRSRRGLVIGLVVFIILALAVIIVVALLVIRQLTSAEFMPVAFVVEQGVATLAATTL